jgi:3-oxoacyl-[acyl-carrier-protein] synthase-3
VNRPVVLVCAEKFSDKIGSVRPSRMIFGDGAAALVIGPAPPGTPSDVDLIQTYASGPFSEVNSIIWPNPEFDNSITVYGPEVQSLVRRYLTQMMEELSAARDPDDPARSLLDTIDLVVPHQANRTMVTKLAGAVGLAPQRLYFNIDKVGNTSAASIPIAVSDAVAEGVIRRPMRIFAPGFGAGAVAGYAVMHIDPQHRGPRAGRGCRAAERCGTRGRGLIGRGCAGGVRGLKATTRRTACRRGGRARNRTPPPTSGRAAF